MKNNIFLLVILSKLKYTTKAQPHGILNIHIINVKWLGLQNENDMHLKLILTMILAKLVTSIKAIITSLGIPIIQKTTQIKYINSKPWLMHMGYISHSKILNIHLVETCTWTFWLNLRISHSKNISRKLKHAYIYIGQDKIGNHLYKNHQIMCFTKYNPTHKPKYVFYNIVFQHVPFRNYLSFL